jgi:hypothetical protein
MAKRRQRGQSPANGGFLKARRKRLYDLVVAEVVAEVVVGNAT